MAYSFLIYYFTEQSFIGHEISNNNGQTYFQKKKFKKNKTKKNFQKMKKTLAVSSAVWDHLSQVF